MKRVIASGFLYVAPSNIDFSQPSHSTKPDTVPQETMDMKRCIKVSGADAVTGHVHSILVAFNVGNKSDDNHLPICFMKADSTEEIRWWKNILQMFVQRTAANFIPPVEPTSIQSAGSGAPYGTTVIQVNQNSQLSSLCSSRSSSYDHIQPDMETSAKLDLTSPPVIQESHHGTPRSVKFRNKVNKEGEPMRKQVTDTVANLEAPPPLPESPCPDIVSPRKVPLNVPFSIDTSNAHTLRKGWLVLRGKNETEWNKHWVVLAGLSLKLYKDVWAEDSNEPLLSIDLTECENVYPSASAKNYGIEIKCRRTRYILSAMTPGIRDSWIAALQQNLHDPSPTFIDTCQSDAASLPDTEVMSILPRKKHIAYVAPESHHSNSMMDEDSCSEGELAPDRWRSHRERRISGSDRSIGSSGDEINRDTLKNQQSARQCHVAQDSSLSPTVRRSPISRIKDKSSTRQNPIGAIRSYGSNSSLSSTAVQLASSKHKSISKNSMRDRSFSRQAIRLRSLETQVETLLDQLRVTTSKLGETRVENERLHSLLVIGDSQGLSQLRKSLSAAEQEVISKQMEMETLRQRLASPVVEDSVIFHCPKEVIAQLISLLKLQVGALSKFVHGHAGHSKITQLRNFTDALIRTVARLDSIGQKVDIEAIISAFDQVLTAYEKLNEVINSSVTNLYDRDMNAQQCEEEMECLRQQYDRQIQALRDRVAREEKRRKQAQEDLQTINEVNDHSLSALKQTHEETIAELRQYFEEQVASLGKEHYFQLNEEKEATKIALDAVQRVHDEEMKGMAQKLEELGVKLSLYEVNVSSEHNFEAQSTKLSRVVEQMSAELAQLSALYSAKCIENAQLDEKMSSLLADKENNSSYTDLKQKNCELCHEIQQKDSTISDLRLRIQALEKQINLCSKRESEEDIGGEPQVSKKKPEAIDVSTLTHIRQHTLCSETEADLNQQPRVARQLAAQNQVGRNQPVLLRKVLPPLNHKVISRRNDVRFHSNPAIPHSNCLSVIMDRTIFVPVSERRKFFEMIAEYEQPF